MKTKKNHDALPYLAAPEPTVPGLLIRYVGRIIRLRLPDDNHHATIQQLSSGYYSNYHQATTATIIRLLQQLSSGYYSNYHQAATATIIMLLQQLSSCYYSNYHQATTATIIRLLQQLSSGYYSI